MEDVWKPSCDEERNPGELNVEDDDGAVSPAFVVPTGRCSRAKKRESMV